jgi:hypothetical protein
MAKQKRIADGSGAGGFNGWLLDSLCPGSRVEAEGEIEIVAAEALRPGIKAKTAK